jgi:hypothetical protein
MCTVLLPSGDNPIAVNKYVISYHLREIQYKRSENNAVDNLQVPRKSVQRSPYLYYVRI